MAIGIKMGGSYGSSSGAGATLPPQVTAFRAIADSDKITVSWANPSQYWDGTLILKKKGSAPQTLDDGEIIYNGKGTSFADSNVQKEAAYYYRAFPYNVDEEYQTQYTVVSATVRNGILLGSLPVGAIVDVPVKSAWQSRFGKTIAFKIADKNHQGYPENSVTFITDKIIQLMPADAKEPNNSSRFMRKEGNNRYIWSNIAQWLNSDKESNWYTAQHSTDAPPTKANVYENEHDYDTWAGFLFMLDPKFVSKLMNTKLIVAKPSINENGGTKETFAAKMFLPSATEINYENYLGWTRHIEGEGLAFSLFKGATENKFAYCTPECVQSNKLASFDNTRPHSWTLRTVGYYTESDKERSYGTEETHFLEFIVGISFAIMVPAYDGHGGIRSCCNLPSNTLLSPVPNPQGHYELL